MLRKMMLFFIVVCVICMRPAYAINITPIKFSWALDDENNPVNVIEKSPTTIKSRPIYVTFAIIGTNYDWDDLESDGALSIRIEFRVDGKVEASPEIGITPALWIRDREGLKRELNERDFFDWRTVALILKPLGKKLEVIIRDSRGNVLSPSGYSGSLYKPTISFRR